MSVLMHPKTEERLLRIRESGAYVVHGKPGAGRLAAVMEVLDGFQVQLLQPDPKAIKIARIQEVIRELRLTPSHQKTAIVIDDAETLTLPAQNALLKTLEELPAHTRVVLITEQAEGVIPTIVSRVVSIYFREPSTEAVEEWLKTTEPELRAEVREELLTRIGPLPAAITAALKQDNSAEGAPERYEHIVSLVDAVELEQRMHAAGALQKELPGVLDDIIRYVRAQLRTRNDPVLADIAASCVKAQAHLRANAQKRHVLDIIALREKGTVRG